MAAIKVDKMLAELADQVSIPPTQITDWKQQLLARAEDVLDESHPLVDTSDLKTLHAKIGQLTQENNFFRRRAPKAGLLSAKR
jgi:transposase